jgi:NADPH:quinone reductase
VQTVTSWYSPWEAPSYGPDLSYLVELVSFGEPSPQIGCRGAWQQTAEAVDALLERRVHGKIVPDLRA